MTEQDDLFTGARRVFWGYFFLLLDFNLNLGSDVTIPLLANVIGWVFLWMSSAGCSCGGGWTRSPPPGPLWSC